MASLAVLVGPNLLLGGYLLWQFIAQRRRDGRKPRWVGLWLLGGVFLALGWLLVYAIQDIFMLVFLTLICDAFWYVAARWCRREQAEAAQAARLARWAGEEADTWPPRPEPQLKGPDQPAA